MCINREYWRNADSETRYCLVGTPIVIAIIMICSMVPMSYNGVEYDDYGIDRDKLLNKVNYDRVYSNGNYFLGLNHEFIKFPRVYQFEEFTGDKLSVFSKEGIEFGFQCTFQWKPKKEAIPDIHRQFRVSYRPQVINRFIATVKNTVTKYTTDDFINSRDLIDRDITTAIGDAVDELGFDIPADKFQFAKPLLPDNVRSRFLQTQVQLVKNDEQTLRQQQAVVLQETQRLVAGVTSNATAVIAQADFTAQSIIDVAIADSTRIVNQAEQESIAQIVDLMGVDVIKVMYLEDANTKLYVGSSDIRFNMQV
jgi:regulator of protease activity HflC (stomatin/prohibitin superfamily)